MTGLAVYINGTMKRPEDCRTTAEIEYYWLMYDKIMEEARDAQEEIERGEDE